MTIKEGMREVAHKLQPTWSDEQFDAAWQKFQRLRAAVARGRRKQAAKHARAKVPNEKLCERGDKAS